MDKLKKQVIKIATKLYKGEGLGNYSTEEGNELVRKHLAELTGWDERTQRIDHQVFRRNRLEFYDFIEVVINETIHESLAKDFADQFVEYRNLAWGDTNLFKVPANKNFRVALVSDGNLDVRAERLKDGSEYSVGLQSYAVKVGEELHRILAGRVDFAEMARGAADAFRKDVKHRVFTALVNSYGQYGTTYHKSFVGGTAPTANDILQMASHLEARTGEKVAIYGTKLALSRLPVAYLTEKNMNEFNERGYVGMISGVPTMEIPNSLKESSKNGDKDVLALGDDFILLLPQNKDRMIKVVNEGRSIIKEASGTDNIDLSSEYTIVNRFGVMVMSSKAYGYIKF